MVSVVHSVAAQSDPEHSLQTLCEGVSEAEAEALREAAGFARQAYADHYLGSGEGVWRHALGMALILVGLKLDANSRLAALLFALPTFDENSLDRARERFGAGVTHLVDGITRLSRLRPIKPGFVAPSMERGIDNPQELKAQVEVLRKMLLAMVEDIRVVVLRLASRTQTLRFYAESGDPLRTQVARETLELYSPLANRLGIWELKWELEDLSFRFLHPDIYRRLAKDLDEKRSERELFIATAIERVKHELKLSGIGNAEVYGRPKHIYSIWNKMRKKDLDFSEVYDIRALRIIVDDIKGCYTALGIVHNLWTPIPKEFDDYIAHPKSNDYRSLHTAVRCTDGRSMEIQIRTWEMHRHAELGVAAHWRYKEGSTREPEDNYDQKIARLRQILTWKEEVADASDWVRHYRQAALDETIYVMTPQGRVVDLPYGATPVDFAYRVHTDLGHRCRGAKVNGALVPLNTLLETGQRVEIVAAREGGPSRDWLNPNLGYLISHRSRAKVRAWFAAQATETTLAEGRAVIHRELQRLGQTGMKIEELAEKLGFPKLEALFLSAGRNELNLRQLQNVVRGVPETHAESELPLPRRATAESEKGDQGILVVGIGKLMSQLARCCKPAPPEPIQGFVTRGKGISIHRADCSNFQHLAALHPERVIETAWGRETEGSFPVDIRLEASDRQGLLRDISDIFMREKLNVTAVNTQSRQDKAYMSFTIEISGLKQLDQILRQLREVSGVLTVARR
ncbi:MAG: bifunctional (p)ppGpp synthetase/guanosine-3',5'-bis(diphosphate) 3'-pyrophosphohydrolase [Betaproteobacteria bacterium]|nr:bifunctional (p)ppGpp synthetase/guanosine-3',5'-bis(diphosphate) 3'-pyrophosphohydrolase [Betaproteobacteria bacterium]